jgi:SAM-dependent methyltransferase
MNRSPKKRLEPWQSLQTSNDCFSDICDIYDADFLTGFALRFDLNPEPLDLLAGVANTARAYITGKWAKSVENSKFLQYTGVHLIGAGLSARRLSNELDQVARSKRATQAIHEQLQSALTTDATRPYATRAYESATFRTGPQSRLSVIQELASALEEAIGEIIALPSKYDEETDAAQRAFDFVSTSNSAAEKLLSKNHAVEEAARAFKPQWEAFSSVAYRRGRFNDRLGVYNCQAGDALHLIIAKLDSKVALSLAGTAIKNIGNQP